MSWFYLVPKSKALNEVNSPPGLTAERLVGMPSSCLAQFLRLEAHCLCDDDWDSAVQLMNFTWLVDNSTGSTISVWNFRTTLFPTKSSKHSTNGAFHRCLIYILSTCLMKMTWSIRCSDTNKRRRPVIASRVITPPTSSSISAIISRRRYGRRSEDMAVSVTFSRWLTLSARHGPIIVREIIAEVAEKLKKLSTDQDKNESWAK